MSNNVNLYMSFFLRMVGNLYSFIYGQVKCIIVKLRFFFKYSINEKVYYWKLQNLIPADFIATPVRVIKVITKNEAMSRQITANCSEGKRNI